MRTDWAIARMVCEWAVCTPEMPCLISDGTTRVAAPNVRPASSDPYQHTSTARIKVPMTVSASPAPTMRAAVVEDVSTVPLVRMVDRPVPAADEVLVAVSAAGLNPHDLVVAAGIRGKPPVPYVTGTEGVGRLADGQRVYFGPLRAPGGSMAEYAAVPMQATTALPDGLSDADALGLGVAGTTAWLAMTWKANLQPGESVLVLGATGAVGQIAVQAAKLLGASRVVAAGRHRETLQSLRDRGADETVVLEGAYEQALVDASRGGFDLTVDSLFGAPMAAALVATKHGGRLVNLGMRAGRTVELSGIAQKGRDILSYSGDLPPATAHRAAFARMARYVLSGALVVASETLPLEDIATAWKRQAESPNRKLVLIP
jgi:NADPH:quinone reductase